MTRPPRFASASSMALPAALALALTACATQVPPAQDAEPEVAQTPTASPPTAPGMTPADAITAPLPPPQRPGPDVRAAFVADTATRYGLDPAYIESMLDRAQILESTITLMAGRFR